MISTQIMVTKGEWALRHLEVTVVNLNISENHKNIVYYTVKETHFLPHIPPSVRLWFLVFPVIQ